MDSSGKVDKPLGFTRLSELERDRVWRKVMALIHITNQVAHDLHKVIVDTKNKPKPLKKWQDAL
jgi:hypothetical protein